MEATAEEVQVARYPAYKDSGVEWLGEIPAHWKTKRVKYVLDYRKGKNPKDIVLEETEYIYLSMEYLRSSSTRIQYATSAKGLVSVEDGDILLLWDGSNAGEFVRGKRGILSSTMALINVKDVNNSFSWHFFKVIERQLRESTVGMGIPHVSGDELKNLLFLLPPKEEQTAIAQFLDRKTAQIDKAISIKEKQIVLLKERRQVLIHQAVTRGLNPNAPLKDSGVEWIGEIPAHWDLVSNKILFQERKEPGSEELPLLMVSIHSAVSSEEISDEENIRGKIRIEDKSNYKLVKVGDVVFNMMRAWQGAIGAVRVEGMVSPAYIVAKPIASFNSDFFEFQYRTAAFIQQMDRASKGITDFRKRLYWDEFKQLFTILPPETEQAEIAEFILTLNSLTDKAISSKQKEIEKLKEYKASLINSAVTGKIKLC